MKTVIRVAILCACLLPASAFSIEPDMDVTYKTVGDVALQLQIFHPKGWRADDRRPAIVFFFGGGWASGTPKQFFQQARELADLGLVAISADYRVSSRHKTSPFEAVSDAKSAIRWMRQHAAELGIDPTKIVASGGSAGGHLAVCAAVIEGQEEPGEDLAVSSIPDAVIAFNPVLDTTAKGLGIKRVGEARQFEVSPCHHVRPGLVPMLILHGTHDQTVPFENAKRFTHLMKESGNRCDLAVFKGEGHGFFNSKFFRPRIDDTSIYERGMTETITFLESLNHLDSLSE